MSQSLVTVDSPLEAIGIRLLPSSSAEFQAVLSPDRDKTSDSLLRYSVLLKNDTSKNILAYTILWIYTDSNGNVQTSEDAWFDFSAFPSPHHLQSHRSKFVSADGPDTFDTPTMDPSALSSTTMQLFDKQKNVNIVLSAVLFDDGTAAGPDTRGWISRWQAYLNAEREVFAAAFSSRSGELRTVMGKFVHDASVQAKPVIGHSETGDLGYGELFEAFRIGDGFDQQYTFFAGASAARILRHLQDTDESTIRDELAKVIASKSYPRVRKLGALAFKARSTSSSFTASRSTSSYLWKIAHRIIDRG